MHDQARLRSNLWKMALYWFCHSLILGYVIERLFWQERGMTVQHVVYIEILYGAIIALLEIPTGVLADRRSRKWMMVVGGIFAAMEFLVLIYASSFWHFAASSLAAAIHGAVTSGTSNALLYDSLKALGREAEFEKVVGRIRAIDYAGHMIAALLGSIVAVKLGMISNYWLSLASMVVAFLVTLTLIEPAVRTAEEAEHTTMRGIAEQAVGFVKGHPALRFVIFYGVIIGACLVYLDEFWQLYLDEMGFPIILFGVVSGLNSLLTSLGGLVAYRLKQRFSYRGVFTLILISFAAGLLLMGFFNSPVGLLFMVVAYACAGLVEPLVMGYLHHRASSEFRATAESVQSLISRVTTGLVGLLFGYIATRSSVSRGFILLGALLVGYLAIYSARSRVLEEMRDTADPRVEVTSI